MTRPPKSQRRRNERHAIAALLYAFRRGKLAWSAVRQKMAEARAK